MGLGEAWHTTIMRTTTQRHTVHMLAVCLGGVLAYIGTRCVYTELCLFVLTFFHDSLRLRTLDALVFSATETGAVDGDARERVAF